MNRTTLLSAGSLLFVLGLGCTGDEPLRTDVLAAQPPERCLDYQQFTHCALGNARLTVSEAGGLLVDRLAALKDGVAIHLPDVRTFKATGAITMTADSTGQTLVSRSINEGVSTSTMTIQRQGNRSLLTAAFTGSGQGSTYDVILYRDGHEVGVVPNQPGGGNDPVAYMNCAPGNPHYPWCLYGQSNPNWTPPPHFRVMQPGPATDPNDVGACSWQIPRGAGSMLVQMRDGTQVIADEIEVRENVPAAGSYIYASFNRIDYMVNSGTISLGAETIE